MSSNKDEIMQSLIEENEKLRKRITQLERELEIMQSKHVDVLHELLECKLSIREILDILKDNSMFRSGNELGSSDKRKWK